MTRTGPPPPCLAQNRFTLHEATDDHDSSEAIWRSSGEPHRQRTRQHPESEQGNLGRPYLVGDRLQVAVEVLERDRGNVSIGQSRSPHVVTDQGASLSEPSEERLSERLLPFQLEMFGLPVHVEDGWAFADQSVRDPDPIGRGAEPDLLLGHPGPLRSRRSATLAEIYRRSFPGAYPHTGVSAGGSSPIPGVRFVPTLSSTRTTQQHHHNKRD